MAFFNVNVYGRPAPKTRNVPAPVAKASNDSSSNTQSAFHVPLTPAVNSLETIVTKGLDDAGLSSPSTTSSTTSDNNKRRADTIESITQPGVSTQGQSSHCWPPFEPQLYASGRKLCATNLGHSGQNALSPGETDTTLPITLPVTHGSQIGRSASTAATHNNPAITNGKSMATSSDLLAQLRNVSMVQINRNVATRKRDKDKLNTTSLRDLDLARTPVNPNKPSQSKRTWAQEHSITNGEVGGEVFAAPPAKKEDSRVSQVAEREPHTSTPSIGEKKPAELKHSKWATREETKPERQESDSNACGSENPSDATRASNVSDRSFGRLLNRQGEEQIAPLANWDGSMIPPPADWNERPRYNNNNESFKASFKDWHESVENNTLKRGRFSNGVPYTIIPTENLEDLNLHADGISMVTRDTVIHPANAAYYGYTDNPEEATKYWNSDEAADFTDWGRVDHTDVESTRLRNETTNDLVTNWVEHYNLVRVASIRRGKQTDSKEIVECVVEPANTDETEDLYKASLNIYLRPATALDMEEMTRIYNQYITNGVGPVETREIDQELMRIRLDQCKEGNLPFIVAAKKNQKGARAIEPVNDDEYSRRRNLPVIHAKRITLTRVEMLAGFCCVNDFNVPDYVEHITGEIEIYVDQQYKKMGVATCLMDKILQICDRGHRLTTACDFHCDQDIQHFYGPGGNRDLHRLVVVVRKWSTPRAATINIDKKRGHRKSAFAKTIEDLYGQFLKKWLESTGFRKSGMLEEVGAKNGRYLDIVYFTRSTAWSPTEGDVPGPDPRHEYDPDDDDNDEDDENDY